MRNNTIVVGKVALMLVAMITFQAAAQTTRFDAKPGSKMRVEGTSNIHDWQVEGSLIGGFIEAGSNFPTEPGASVKPGKVEAKVEAFVPVRSLKSVEKDGKAYSDKMDDIMYEKLKSPPNARINFRLTELTLKEAAKGKDDPYVMDAKGELAVGGVTNAISMPVKVLPQGDKKMRVSGSVPLKMTDFKIDPPAPKIALGLIKTGDDIKIIFDWNIAQKAPAAAAK